MTALCHKQERCCLFLIGHSFFQNSYTAFLTRWRYSKWPTISRGISRQFECEIPAISTTRWILRHVEIQWQVPHNDAIWPFRCLKSLWFDCLFNLFRLTTKKTSSKIAITVPMSGEISSDQWITIKKSQLCGKLFHDMTSSCSSFRLDYCGIIGLFVTSCVPWFHYGFYCHESLRIFYISLMIILGTIGTYIVLNPEFGETKYKPLRAGGYYSMS